MNGFPDPTVYVILFRASADCEAYVTGEFESNEAKMMVINGLRQAAGELELEMREELGEFDMDLEDGDEDDETHS